jgi:hypothetical protein
VILGAGVPTLPWAIRPGNTRRRAVQTRNGFGARKPLVVFGFYVIVFLLALRLQCACWRSQAERWLCPPPQETSP